MLQEWRRQQGCSFEDSGENGAWLLQIRGKGPEKRSRSGLLQSDSPLQFRLGELDPGKGMKLN